MTAYSASQVIKTKRDAALAPPAPETHAAESADSPAEDAAAEASA
jgi:hypothetical protein